MFIIHVHSLLPWGEWTKTEKCTKWTKFNNEFGKYSGANVPNYRAQRFQESAGKRRDWQSLLRIRTSVSAAADRPASYGNQIISSTRPSCWIQMSTVMPLTLRWSSDVYNTDRRTKLTALETISRWLLLKKRKKSLFEPPFRAIRGNVHVARWKARGRLYIRRK